MDEQIPQGTPQDIKELSQLQSPNPVGKKNPGSKNNHRQRQADDYLVKMLQYSLDNGNPPGNLTLGKLHSPLHKYALQSG
jgi:hypothetical protein